MRQRKSAINLKKIAPKERERVERWLNRYDDYLLDGHQPWSRQEVEDLLDGRLFGFVQANDENLSIQLAKKKYVEEPDEINNYNFTGVMAEEMAIASLKFASTDEALQYMADKTGKTVKLAAQEYGKVVKKSGANTFYLVRDVGEDSEPIDVMTKVDLEGLVLIIKGAGVKKFLSENPELYHNHQEAEDDQIERLKNVKR